MRLDEERSQREPFDARDLQTIFNAPLFTELRLPVGAKGEAGIWLPLLALFGGARQAEYAGLRVSDIREDGDTRVPLMWFIGEHRTKTPFRSCFYIYRDCKCTAFAKARAASSGEALSVSLSTMRLAARMASTGTEPMRGTSARFSRASAARFGAMRISAS